MANLSTRFHKYFRVTHTRFDEIYLAAADSGEFRLNPDEPGFDRAFLKGLPASTVPNFPRSVPSV